MLRRAVLVFLSCLLTGASCLLSFVNPQNADTDGDFSKVVAYPTGSVIDIRWTGGEAGKAVSIILWQLNQTTGEMLDEENDSMEYIIQDSVHAKQIFTWLVGSRKNLATSNLFYMAIFQEGKPGWDANTHYFNITARGTADTESSSSSTSSSLLPSSTASLPTEVSTSRGSSEPTGASTTNTGSNTGSSTGAGTLESSSNSFPDSAKIGLGVGIPVALLLGAVAGFLWFRRQKKKYMNAAPPIAHMGYSPSELHSPHKSHVDSHYSPRRHEAPLRSPVEMS